MNEATNYLADPIILEAAYGRSYTTAEAALCAWKEGKDFKIRNGPYCSIRDIDSLRYFGEDIYITYKYGVTKI